MTQDQPGNSNITLETICTTRDAVEAELVKNTLQDHGIQCQITGEHQGGFTGTFAIGILVRRTDLDQAREFLRVHHPHLIE